jgi:hypothetical protein
MNTENYDVEGVEGTCTEEKGSVDITGITIEIWIQDPEIWRKTASHHIRRRSLRSRKNKKKLIAT